MIKISEGTVTIAGRRIPLRRVQTINEEPTRTKTQFQKNSDIKTIIRRALKTGQLPTTGRVAIFGDFTKNDFLEKLNTVAQIKSQFEQLDPKIRGRFRNDPAELMSWIQDPENYDEAIKLGLIEKPKVQDPPPTDARAGQPGGPPSNTPAAQ